MLLYLKERNNLAGHELTVVLFVSNTFAYIFTYIVRYISTYVFTYIKIGIIYHIAHINCVDSFISRFRPIVPNWIIIFSSFVYLLTWILGVASTAPWPSQGLHHCGKFLEPSDE